MTWEERLSLGGWNEAQDAEYETELHPIDLQSFDLQTVDPHSVSEETFDPADVGPEDVAEPDDYLEAAGSEDDNPQAWELQGENDKNPESWLHAYREFILSTDAYQWLLTWLQRELLVLQRNQLLFEPFETQFYLRFRPHARSAERLLRKAVLPSLSPTGPYDNFSKQNSI